MERIHELPNDEATHHPPVYVDAFGTPPYVWENTGLYSHPLPPLAICDMPAQLSHVAIPSSTLPYTSIPIDQPVSHEQELWSGHLVPEKHKISRPPLTDGERQKMCFFHETAWHMGAKQDEIGGETDNNQVVLQNSMLTGSCIALFNVDRT